MYDSAIDILKRNMEELEMEAVLWDNENKPDNADFARKAADSCQAAIDLLSDK